jgi:hypothetical protein
MPASFIDKTGPYTLPTGWHEVTTRQFCDLDRLQLRTAEARASYFAGRDIQVNVAVADCVAFLIQRADGSYSIPTTGGLPYPADLGQETYLQVEEIRASLATPLHMCYAHLYGTFVARRRGFQRREFRQDDVLNLALHSLELPITDTYPAVAHCINELHRLSNPETGKYKELSEPDPTEAGARARAAGADELLGLFGHFNVAKALAERQGRTVDEVYQTPWETIAITLLHDRRQAILSDTIQRNSKTHE